MHNQQILGLPDFFRFKEGTTDTIKFFSYSLREANYLYYQAILDEVNLYESITHLILYYNQNRPNRETRKMVKNNAQEEMSQEVNSLITVYGRTQDNKDK